MLETAEKGIDAVGAGEDDPVVMFQVRYGSIQCLVAVCRRRDADGRHFQAAGAQFFQAVCQVRRLGVGPGDGDGQAEERLRVEPLHGRPQGDDVADDEDGRCLEMAGRRFFGDVSDRSHQRFLVGLGAPADQGCRRRRRPAVGDELLGDGWQVVDAHEEDQRIDGRCQFVPVNR